MRILFVVPTFWPAVRYGGTITATLDLSSALVALGHSVEVFTTDVDGSSTISSDEGNPAVVNGVLVHYFPVPCLRRIYYSPAMRSALNRRVKEFDLVTLHSIYLYPIVVAGLACRKHNVRYIAFPHGMLVRSLITAKGRWHKSVWLQLFGRSIFENALGIRVTSAVEASDVREFGWRLPPLINIPNSVGNVISELNEDACEGIARIAQHQPLILYFGRLSWKKGLATLVEAFAKTSKGHLAIVGPDDESLAEQLRSFALSLSVSERVTIMPKMVIGSDSEMLFRAAKLFVLTSVNENFGNTVTEAMARGVPVVVTAGVGASEHVARSGAGVVVPQAPKQIAEAIDQLLNDEVTRLQMGVAGKAYVTRELAPNKIAAQFITQAQNLLERDGNRGGSGGAPNSNGVAL